jgi:DNA replication protein
MYNLIKNDIIQFDKLIIEKYSQLGIDEVDTIILIRLNDLLKRGKRLLQVEEIAPSMKIKEEELGRRIVDLVTKGYITLELSSIDAKETFNLDETYRRLSYLLDADNQNQSDSHLNIQMKSTVKLLEKELNKILSPLELEMVSRWYLEDKYDENAIQEAILKALKYKNRGVAYIDRSLAASKKQYQAATQPTSAENIKELFNKVYAKSK